MLQKITVWSDGGCRVNPGPASWAWVINLGNGQKASRGGFVEHASNNFVEYRAVCEAAEYLLSLDLAEPADIEFRSDSQLIVNQLNGAWQVRQESLVPIYERALGAIARLKDQGHRVTLRWVRRSENKEADEICNRVQDAHGVVALSWKEKIKAQGAMQ